MVFNDSLVLEFFESMERRLKTEDIIERDLKTKPVRDKVVVIIGPRRAGKTYYLFHKKREHGGVYIDFEGIEFSKLEGEDVIKIVKLYENYYSRKVDVIYLDEVQSLKNWERVVRSLLNLNYKVYVTGSSSKLLSKEIASLLRGRSLSYLLLPFSFEEFLKVKQLTKKETYSISEVTRIKNYLRDYLDIGGFPEVVLKEEKEKILREYVDLAFFKDFVERHEIKSMEVARIIFEYILQNFSKEISITKIQNFIEKTIGVKTKTTIYDYLEKLQDTMFFFFVERYEPSVYKRKKYPKKAYLCDVGLTKIFRFSEDSGKKMENVVFLEILRKTNEKAMEIYYLRTREGYEVDFLVKDGERVTQLIQVTRASAFDEINHREIRALLHAYNILKEHKPELLVITWDYEDTREIRWFGKSGKIKFLPLWKWLLDIK